MILYCTVLYTVPPLVTACQAFSAGSQWRRGDDPVAYRLECTQSRTDNGKHTPCIPGMYEHTSTTNSASCNLCDTTVGTSTD